VSRVSRTSNLSPWLAARVQPSCEFRAAWHIENQGHEYWLPMFLETVQHHSGRLLFVQRFMFPGYVLVRPSTPGYWSWLAGTRGVASVVMTGEQPSRLAWEDVNYLRSIVNEDGFVVTPRSTDRFQTNDPVFVARGSFAIEGMPPVRGVYLGRTVRDWVRILLHLLGSNREVQVREKDLDPIAVCAA
jgi:transcription antitermination factor NusG